MATLRSIGKKIASERIRLGLTQEDLAGLAGIDRSFLSYIENGKKNFSVAMLLNIAAALKAEPSMFFD